MSYQGGHYEYVHPDGWIWRPDPAIQARKRNWFHTACHVAGWILAVPFGLASVAAGIVLPLSILGLIIGQLPLSTVIFYVVLSAIIGVFMTIAMVLIGVGSDE